jgi:uncharacterized membrane protein YphA (DoxX/SURF4 family)
MYLNGPRAAVCAWITGSIAMSAGVALVLGVTTSVAAFLVVAGVVCTSASWLPSPTPNLFEPWPVAALVIIVAAAILFLGPGAFSIDARLFGLRKITISR